MVISGMFSACSTMFQGGTQVVLGTSFTAEDEDILGTDEDYTALENDLRSQVDNIESTHPGYDEYRYALDEIGHNPYELAAYLTVVFEDYTREEVQAELVRLFEEQYDLELDEEVEIRSYTTTDEDGNTSTVYYEYRILNVTLTNYGLGNVIASSRLTAEQWERYKVLLETLGNRSYLFGEDVSSAPGGGGEYTDYDIPGEALTDTALPTWLEKLKNIWGIPMFGVVLPLLPVLIVLDSSAGSSITAAMDGVSADKLRTGLKTSVILFRLLKQTRRSDFLPGNLQHIRSFSCRYLCGQRDDDSLW